ncbi:M15 family metallopeptidase [Nocardioides sp. SR21]|uniref:M15 family metallopeptidase n=1 Tax=Nocardioides sp. SR21 TaxID=2919501 RepID=UPI001FAA29D3|nr:M15 family metallopeptidase [Nocardioides sp. SR21]
MRLGRALGAATLALAIAATSACSGSSEAGDPAPDGTTSAAAATPSPDAEPGAEPTLDPAHAVDPPGRRTGLIAPADIVVNGASTIPQEKVAEIERLRGVEDVERISLVQIPVENRSLSIAAVDPATYRNWITDTDDAKFDDAWERVAAGELAIPEKTVRRLPVDDNGFLPLGSTSDAPQAHVGAYTEQSWLVDAVVNDTWVSTLDMTEGNALLIRTGGVAPEPLRKPIQQILAGTDATVSMTDAVARNGLDPGVVQTAVVVGTIADAVGTYRYSVLSGGRIAPDPAWVREHIVTAPVPILGNVTCNKLLIPQLRAALEDVVAQGLADKIHPDDYAGCYNPRFIAGSTTLSNHAFGLAVDLNVAGNERGTVGEIDRGVVAIFEHWGFTWGGDWAYTDPMHFEMNQLVQPR